MKVKIKKLYPSAQIPIYAKEGDAGLDLTAISKTFDEYENVVYGTGLAIEIPYGFVGLIFPRSSVSKQNLLLCNSVGVIDSGYRGEIICKFKSTSNIISEMSFYSIGDKVCQLIIVPYPQIELEEVEELTTSERGSNGFGSTGK